jgi:hypothetical protein
MPEIKLAAKVEFTGEEIIEARGETKKLPRFAMLAYTGKAIQQPFGKVVIDLATAEAPAQGNLKILHDHDARKVVGHGSAEIKDGQISASGVISGTGSAAKEVIETSGNGFPWEASVGGPIRRIEKVDAGEKVQVNGREFEGPLLVARGFKLKEISFVTFGADDDTAAQVAAKSAKSEDRIMGFDEWLKAKGFGDVLEPEQIKTLEAAYKAEQGETEEVKAKEPAPEVDVKAALQQARKEETARISAVREACGGLFPEIEAKAIDGGWDVAQTNAEVIKAMRSEMPNVQTGSVVSKQRGSAEVLKASLELRAGFSQDELAKGGYAPEVVEAAYKNLPNSSLKETIQAGLAAEGIDSFGMSENGLIRAAASTASIPGILSNVANKRMLRQFELQSITAPRVCTSGDLNDFKENDRYRLSDIGDLSPVAGDGTVEHGTITEEKAQNRLKTYAKVFKVTRDMLINDDMSALLQLPAAMGARAAQKIDEVFYTRLLENAVGLNGNNLFSTGNANFASGANTALTVGSIDQANQLFRDQTNIDGQPINMMPRILLVPTSLEFKAAQVVNSTTVRDIGATDDANTTTANPVTGMGLQIVGSPWLNAQSLTGSSSTAWYLFADPAIADTFEIGYLRGRRTPTIERFDNGADTVGGLAWQVYFDFGIREQDHRGMVKMAGA